VASITLLEKMACASVGTATSGWCVKSNFVSCVVKFLQDVQTFVENECIGCKKAVAQLSVSAAHPIQSEVEMMRNCLQHAQQHKKMFSAELKNKILGLCKIMHPISSEVSPGLPVELLANTADTPQSRWDLVLCQKFQDVEDDLGNSLQLYAVACRERYIHSLA